MLAGVEEAIRVLHQRPEVKAARDAAPGEGSAKEEREDRNPMMAHLEATPRANGALDLVQKEGARVLLRMDG